MVFSEIKRGLNKKSFWIVLVVMSCICLLSAFKFPKDQGSIDEYIKAYITTSYDQFIMFNLDSLSNLIIIIMPLVCAIIYSDTYLEDVKSGVIKSICTRMDKDKYLRAKYIANFILAGIGFVVPLVLNLLVLMTRYPSIQENFILGKLTIMPNGLVSSLFYEHPLLYMIMWFFIYFLYAGVFASIGLALSVFIKNKFVVVAIPFLLMQLSAMILQIINKYEYCPMSFLYVSIDQSLSIVIGVFLILFIVSFLVFYIGGKKCEIY